MKFPYSPRFVIASEARQYRVSGSHGLPRRCAPCNDRTYVAIGRVRKRVASPFSGDIAPKNA